MKFNPSHSIKEIAALIGAEFVGKPDHVISGLNEIHMVEPGDITFVDNTKYYDKALQSAATTILINKKVEVPAGKAIIISDDPFVDFNKLILHFRSFELCHIGSDRNDSCISHAPEAHHRGNITSKFPVESPVG